MARGIALTALVLAVIVAGYLLIFRGSGGHEYALIFQNAGQLVKDDDVQVGGRRIGSVRSIELTDDNLAKVTVQVQAPYAPLHVGTRAVIRLTSLSGIANRYVALTLAPSNTPKLPDGATLGTETTTSVVDLDQVFNTLDAKTRGNLQDVIKGFATQYQNRGKAVGQSAKYFNPLLSTSRVLADQVTQDQGALTRFLVSTSEAVSAIADRKDALAASVGNANTTAGAIASENGSLSQALAILPTTLRRGNTTFVNLRATLDDLDVLVAQSKPATKDLAPFLAQLRPLVHDARPTVHDLRTLLDRAGPNNDLVDATRKMPALQRVASPAFKDATTALVQAEPVLEFIRPYTPELVGWFRDFGQGASNYDANGHYARIQPIFNAFSFANNPAGGVLTPIPPSQRFDGLQTGVIKRCPGAASQPAADGSSPYTDNGNLGPNDCDPSLAL
ncbi:MAG: phospholipid/cholesterol/gamma-HCH transport system substrate-binding protein, partial [Solirubrobacteraceae bacterium]|nr:phospholipid/cholesterol/gamma-HCH transport system substrate-binding protein [Solirubrobacteraceae bacterium]